MSKNSVDFVIGAKNQAKPAFDDAAKSLQRIEKKAEDTKKSTDRLAMVTGTLAVAYAAVKTALAALGGLDKINQAYQVQTTAVKNLTSAMKVRGGAAQENSAQLQQVAAELQKLTGVGDEVTIGLMQQAAAMGFATDRIDDAAKAAIGLSDVTGKSLETSLSDMKDALQGNFEAFNGLNPQIRFMRTNQEKLAAVMAIAQQGIEQQSQNMNTVAGSSLRANGAFGDLLESIGALIAPIRVLINAGVQQLSESLIGVLSPAVEWATALLENIGPTIEWVKEKVVAAVNIIIGAFTFFETILTNLGDVWNMAVAIAEMSMIAISESVMHTLTVTIPAYAMWFGENLINLMKDAFNGVITIIQNAGKIIGDSVLSIFEFIASGGEGGVSGLMQKLGQAASQGLLDGFESSLTALPDIAERQLTQREQDLADKIGGIGARLGQEFSDKMEERIVGLGGTVQGELNSVAGKINLKANAAVMTQGVGATEGRLLTRGPGTRIPDQLQQIIGLLQKPPEPKPPRILVENATKQTRALETMLQNPGMVIQMEGIA